MIEITEVRAALKLAQNAIILDNSGLALDAIDAALDALRMMKGKRWKHVKRGIVVTEIGRGFVQAATGPLFEMSPVVFYRHDEDGSLWVRHVEEFGDGRFVAGDGRGANE